MRRLFIIRKDLNLTAGKLSAMVGHCAEAYWTNMIKTGSIKDIGTKKEITITVNSEIMEKYVNGSFVKTICQAKNLNDLKKAERKAKELGLIEYIDYGYINDNCLTELEPENPDGTCTVGIWFKPLSDEISHEISKKYQLYKG